MQLTITTDYAIRILLCLVTNKERGIITSSELGAMLNISPNYILKVMRSLTKKQFVLVEVGKRGGFCINPLKEPIQIYDVVKLMEPTISVNQCLESYPKNICLEKKYFIKEYWESVQKQIEQALSITIEELVERYK